MKIEDQSLGLLKLLFLELKEGAHGLTVSINISKFLNKTNYSHNEFYIYLDYLISKNYLSFKGENYYLQDDNVNITVKLTSCGVDAAEISIKQDEELYQKNPRKRK
jgi:hypothetical protein